MTQRIHLHRRLNVGARWNEGAASDLVEHAGIVAHKSIGEPSQSLALASDGRSFHGFVLSFLSPRSIHMVSTTCDMTNLLDVGVRLYVKYCHTLIWHFLLFQSRIKERPTNTNTSLKREVSS
jgi:hypothetical protein